MTGLVERPLPGNGHAGCGRRLGETHRWKHRQGAPGRPHPSPNDLYGQNRASRLHGLLDPAGSVRRLGYPQLTDQAKRKILGENLLRLHGMDVAETRARLGRPPA